MNKKKYRSPELGVWYILSIIFIPGTLLMCGLGIYSLLFIPQHNFSTLSTGIFLAIVGPLFVVVSLRYALFPKCLATLVIKNGELIWKCPTYKTVRLRIEDCVYIGIEDSSLLVKPFHKELYGIFGRGDELVYIYLSTEPFPEKYIHKASIAPCKKGFIKFAYSDRLCQDLVELIPQNKRGSLMSFYYHMQEADREIERKKQAKKNKRKSNKK